MANYKTRSMKPEVVRIYEDLEAWLDHCRFNLLRFDPADLYKSKEWRDFSAKMNGDRRGYRRERSHRNKE